MNRALRWNFSLFVGLILLSALLPLPPVEAIAGTKAGPAFPRDNYVAGWVRSERTLRFEKSNLFDYIDGGAELFLEFGFDVLLVQRYVDGTAEGSAEIALETYQMESPEAALGIYLTKCGKETPVKGMEERNSGDRYQFSVVKGDWFIQVNNFGGDERLIPVMLKLTRRTLAGIPRGRPVTLLARLPERDFVSCSGLIFRGPYALQPIFTFGSGDVLQLRGNVFGVAGDYAGPEGDVYTRLLILYPEPKAALSAFENLSNNLDPYLEVMSRRENGFTFRDYRDKFGTVELKNDVMEIKINLPEKPDE